jgi:hypothetical protein
MTPPTQLFGLNGRDAGCRQKLETLAMDAAEIAGLDFPYRPAV